MVVVQSPYSTSNNESGPASPNSNIQRRPPVVIQQVVVDQDFVQAVQTFDAMLQTGTVLEYCDHQISLPKNSHDEQTVWRFLRASFDADSKQRYIELLGFHRDDIVSRAQMMAIDQKQHPPIERMNGLDIGEHHSTKTSNHGIYNHSQINLCVMVFFFSLDVDLIINRCTMLGQFSVAVDLCLNEQRYAEALLIAQLGGQELLLNTQRHFFEKAQTASTKVIHLQ